MTLNYPYYTVLHAVVSLSKQEFLAVGLLWIDPGYGASLDFSFQKWEMAKHCLSKERVKQLKQRRQDFEKAVEAYNRHAHLQSTSSELSFSYLQYLSRYAQKVIALKEPTRLTNADGDQRASWEKVRAMAFQHLVGDDVDRPKEKVTLSEKIKGHFSKQGAARVSWQYHLTPRDLSGFTIPHFQTLFSGVNDQLVVGKDISFEGGYDRLLGQYAPLELMQKTRFRGKAPKTFAVGQEPKRGSQAHQYWQELRTFKSVEFIELRELARLEEYLKVHDVRPLAEVEKE